MATAQKQAPEWKSLYQSALQESRPAFAFKAIHEATKAMVRHLHRLGSKDGEERQSVLAALDDLRVLRIVFMRTSKMFV